MIHADAFKWMDTEEAHALSSFSPGSHSGIHDIPAGLMYDMLSGLPRDHIAAIDAMADDMLFAGTEEARAAIASRIHEALPMAPDAVLAKAVIHGIPDMRSRDAFRACLLYEAAIASAERAILSDIDSLRASLRAGITAAVK